MKREVNIKICKIEKNDFPASLKIQIDNDNHILFEDSQEALEFMQSIFKMTAEDIKEYWGIGLN